MLTIVLSSLGWSDK